MTNNHRHQDAQHNARFNQERIDASTLKKQINTANFYTEETGFTVPDAHDKWFSTLCPFHEDNRPSLRVHIPGGGFRCMACGERGGDIINFVQIKHGLTFTDALYYLNRLYAGGG